MLRVGHYRWWYCLEGTFFNTSYGMYRAVEDILMSIFPLEFEEKDKDGKWKPVVFLSGGGASTGRAQFMDTDYLI